LKATGLDKVLFNTAMTIAPAEHYRLPLDEQQHFTIPAKYLDPTLSVCNKDELLDYLGGDYPPVRDEICPTWVDPDGSLTKLFPNLSIKFGLLKMSGFHV
jgi:hypothetical protein